MSACIICGSAETPCDCATIRFGALELPRLHADDLAAIGAAAEALR